MKIAAVTFGLLLLYSTAAGAAGTSYMLFDICRFDIDQYCKDIRKTLKKEIRECLAKQEQNLLPRCQDHYKEAH
jgi:hypothetical protein